MFASSNSFVKVMLAITMSTATANALNIPVPRDADTGGVFDGDPSCSQVKAHDGASMMPAAYCAVAHVDGGKIIKDRIKLRKDLKRDPGYKAEGSLFESSLTEEPFKSILAKNDIKKSDKYSNSTSACLHPPIFLQSKMNGGGPATIHRWPAVLDHTAREQKDGTWQMDGTFLPDKDNTWDAGVGIWKLTGKKTKVVKEFDDLFELLKKGQNGPMALRATKGGALVEYRYYSVITTSSLPYNEDTWYYVTLYDPIEGSEKQWNLNDIKAGLDHIALLE
ncbi:hypothetical protein I317_05163 [Kwoniella heveanensis CBS 569]|uniref:Uncharacterized protein n=1 Tax=Kwoniella heveanensis BCC8398 TaxID=1296120 RepID=A0A1B9GV59_9TREE|nr:hypothetical protein I316_03461 [Kwoniella heveanensis BCC8398]OCF41052.1 hypothetical protein I317_05163 [Kwoniella heveanensis CBS 569]